MIWMLELVVFLGATLFLHRMITAYPRVRVPLLAALGVVAVGCLTWAVLTTPA